MFLDCCDCCLPFLVVLWFDKCHRCSLSQAAVEAERIERQRLKLVKELQDSLLAHVLRMQIGLSNEYVCFSLTGLSFTSHLALFSYNSTYCWLHLGLINLLIICTLYGPR